MSEDLIHDKKNEESASGSGEDAERRDAPAPSESLPPGPQPRLRPVTRQRIAANRRNASKSTGPRTLAGKARVAQNGRTHGNYSRQSGDYGQLIVATMQDLGEDPEKFSRLQESLMQDLQPRGAAQAMLVEDLASLRWERQRLERARTALVARRVQQLELVRQRHSLQVSQQITEDIPTSALGMGLLWTRDSATKFQKILEWLEVLKLQMEEGKFSGAEAVVGWIYGLNPTPRGALIKSFFQTLAEAQAPAGKKAATKGGAASRAEPATAEEESASGGKNHLPDPATISALRRELLGEICNVTQQYQLYIREHVEVTPTMRAECLAPTAEQRWLMREMNMIDRQIEKKTRLLRYMKQGEGEDEGDGENPPDGGGTTSGPGRGKRGEEEKKDCLGGQTQTRLKTKDDSRTKPIQSQTQSPWTVSNILYYQQLTSVFRENPGILQKIQDLAINQPSKRCTM